MLFLAKLLHTLFVLKLLVQLYLRYMLTYTITGNFFWGTLYDIRWRFLLILFIVLANNAKRQRNIRVCVHEKVLSAILTF